MDQYNPDFLQNDNDFNEEEEDDININNSDEYSEDNYLENNEEMFGVFDEINKNVGSIEKNMLNHRKKGQMIKEQNLKNEKRLNQNKINEINKYNALNYYDDGFNRNQKLQYTYPSRMNNQFVDISDDNNNYINYKTSNDYNLINTKGSLYSNNMRIKDDSQINNNLYNNNINRIQNNLTYTPYEVKKGFIKKSNSNLNIQSNKSDINDDNSYSMNNPQNINKMNFSKERGKVMNQINDIRFKNKNLIKENKILQSKLSKIESNFAKEIKAKDFKIQELLKEKQLLKKPESEYDKKREKYKSKKLNSLEDEYDKIFNENIKFKEEINKLNQEL